MNYTYRIFLRNMEKKTSIAISGMTTQSRADLVLDAINGDIDNAHYLQAQSDANYDLLMGNTIAQNHQCEELLAELELAHKIIQNGLNSIDLNGKLTWASKNSADHCDGEGITRANEREALINRIKGAAA